MVKVKTAVLIVTYNNDKLASDSFKTLAATAMPGSDCSLTVCNNGPRPTDIVASPWYDQLATKFHPVTLINHLGNRPLSEIYNTFLTDNSAERYIIFDDDSCIPDDFFTTLDRDYSSDPVIDLQLPLIYSLQDNSLNYPKINDVAVRKEGPVSTDQHIVSIGSGLVIYRSLLAAFDDRGIQPFDTRFALYGVDFSFFRRLALLKSYGVVLHIKTSSYLLHGLSAATGQIEAWREKERMYDHILSARYYSDNALIGNLKMIRYIIKYLLRGHTNLAWLSLLTWFRGHHPRSNVDISA